MALYNQKEKIRDHYDRVSPYYVALWGDHIHHGYWLRGDESKEQAQVQLIEHLARAAGISWQARILDIGCGYGGSSIYLAREYGAQTTGITISPVQVQMAREAAAKAGVRSHFLLMDAEAMNFPEPFDVLWSVESISHYQDHENFFASAARLLKRGGAMAITDWFKKDGLTPSQHRKALEPIERGMMVQLRTMEEYESLMVANDLKITKKEILNQQCAKSWDLGLDVIKKKELWAMAAGFGVDFIYFLKAFRAMRAGFASGDFVYGLLVAKKLHSS